MVFFLSCCGYAPFINDKGEKKKWMLFILFSTLASSQLIGYKQEYQQYRHRTKEERRSATCETKCPKKTRQKTWGEKEAWKGACLSSGGSGMGEKHKQRVAMAHGSFVDSLRLYVECLPCVLTQLCCVYPRRRNSRKRMWSFTPH